MHVGAAQTINLYGAHDQKLRWLKPQDGRYLLGTYSTSERASGGHWWYNFSRGVARRRRLSRQCRKVLHHLLGQGGLLHHADAHARTRAINRTSPSSSSMANRPASRPGPWNALGVRGNHSGPIRYEGVKVARRNRLGEENQGKDIIYNGVSPVYLIGLGAVWEGVARGAHDAAVAHIKNSIHKDTNKRLADYQAIRQELAKPKVLIESLGPWRRELAAGLDALWRDGQAAGGAADRAHRIQGSRLRDRQSLGRSRAHRHRRLRLQERRARALFPRRPRRHRHGAVEHHRARLDRQDRGRSAARAVLRGRRITERRRAVISYSQFFEERR